MAEARLNVQIRTPEGYCTIDYVLRTETGSLFIRKTGASEKRHTIEAHLTIGRKHKTRPDITIDEEISKYARAVSRDHGEIWYANGDGKPKWLYKNNSSYGTRVNKKQELIQQETLELSNETLLELGRVGKDLYAVAIKFKT